MGSLDDLVRDLRRFDGKKEVTKALRKQIRKPVPGVRKAIRARAVGTLPRRGGLNRWVAKARINVSIKLAGRTAGVKLRGGRNSDGGRTDLKRIDQGRVRAPTWGRKGRGAWHVQKVTPGFFTGPAAETSQWRDACVKAVDDALDIIRRG